MGSVGLAGPERQSWSSAGRTTRTPTMLVDSTRPFTTTTRSVTNPSPAMPCETSSV